jgi:hypothetical protein
LGGEISSAGEKFEKDKKDGPGQGDFYPIHNKSTFVVDEDVTSR